MSAAHEARVAAEVAALDGWSPPALPDHVRDQLDAASAEARRLLGGVGGGPQWSWPPGETDDVAAIAQVWARVALACADAGYCVHLATGGPQVVHARLAVRRLDCSRCARTVRKTPPDEDTRCVWCGDRGVTEFTPIVLHVGPVVVVGDACGTCGTALRGAAGVAT